MARLSMGLLFVALTSASMALAHGINGHVHVTGWAIANLPPGELKDFFADPAVRDAALLGAAFPDSGYAIDDPYGELAHWPPFVDAYRVHLQANVGPPFDDLEARKHAAFWMGLACHGLQDEMFDSLFLHQVREKDGGGQDEADPGTDAFLYTDGYLHFKPPFYVPAADLAAVFEAAFGHVVAPSTIETGVRRVKLLVIDAFAPSAEILDRRYRPIIPWTADHYVDPAVPGSLAAEVPATGAFLQALWERLHDRARPDALVVHPWPSPGRRLRGNHAASVDSWVTLVLGAGTPRGDFPERVQLETEAGEPVPFDLSFTRWSSRPEEATRILQLRPRADLAANARLRVRVAGGATRIDGVVTDDWAYEFQTACGPDDTCDPEPDGGAPPLADAAPPPDAASADASLPDAEQPDARQPDSATPDSAMPDSATPDPAALDAATPGDALVEQGASQPGGSGCAQFKSHGPLLVTLICLIGVFRRRA